MYVIFLTSFDQIFDHLMITEKNYKVKATNSFLHLEFYFTSKVRYVINASIVNFDTTPGFIAEIN